MILFFSSSISQRHEKVRQALAEQEGLVESFYSLPKEQGLLIATFPEAEAIKKVSAIVSSLTSGLKGNDILVPFVTPDFDIKNVSPRVAAWIQNHDDSQEKAGQTFSFPSWDVVVGREWQKERMQEIVSTSRLRGQFGRVGIELNTVIDNVLLFGNPGTGKHLMSRVLQGKLAETFEANVSAFDMRVLHGMVYQNAVDTLKRLIKDAAGSIVLLRHIDTLMRPVTAEQEITLMGPFLSWLKADTSAKHIIATASGDDFKAYAQSEPALRQAFPCWIDFEDYTIPELTNLFETSILDTRLDADEGVLPKAAAYLRRAKEVSGASFGNAHAVDDLFEKSVQAMLVRQRHALIDAASKGEAAVAVEKNEFRKLGRLELCDIPVYGQAQNKPVRQAALAVRGEKKSNVVPLFSR